MLPLILSYIVNAANVPVPAGTYTIEVAATDRAGNAGAVARGTVVAQ